MAARILGSRCYGTCGMMVETVIWPPDPRFICIYVPRNAQQYSGPSISKHHDIEHEVEQRILILLLREAGHRNEVETWHVWGCVGPR